MTEETNEQFLPAKEIEKITKISTTTIHKWRKKGLLSKIEKLPGRKPRFVFRLSDIEKFQNLGFRDAL